MPEEEQITGLRKALYSVTIAAAVLIPAGVASATPSPNGPGQPGAPATTCGSANTALAPGASASAQGAPFNANGTDDTMPEVEVQAGSRIVRVLRVKGVEVHRCEAGT
jgi:hypothetical protein